MPVNNPIPLEIAEAWAKAWQDKTAISGSSFKASLIPMADILSIQNDANAVNIRAYNAYDEENDEYKLLLVGVDENGNDIIDVSSANTKIYDLTLPCPDTCDQNSPLFNPE